MVVDDVNDGKTAEERVQEARKAAAAAKKEEKEAKIREQKMKMLERENEEAQNQGDLVLIYPLIPYKLEFYIEENFERVKAKLVEEIKEKEKEHILAAGGDRKNVDIELVKKDVYFENIP